MAVDPGTALKQILAEESEAVLHDVSRFSALLRARAGSHASECQLLEAAVETRIVDVLTVQRGQPLAPADRDRLVRRMATQSMLPPDSCAWAVDIWAWALDRRADAPAASSAAPNAPVITFTLEKDTIQAGEEAVLRWTVENARRVTLHPPGNAITSKREWRDRPERTTTYTIRAENGPAVAEASVQVEVVTGRGGTPMEWRWLAGALVGAVAIAVMSGIGWNRLGSPEPTIFTVNPTTLEAPGDVVISWSAPQSVRIEASPASRCQHRGSYIVCAVNESMLLTLTAWDGTVKVAERIVEIPVGAGR
jgi:hypothetical protein